MAIKHASLPPVAGYNEIEYGKDHVYQRFSDGRLFYSDLSPVVPYTASENREHAYETLKIIEFRANLLTVDEAGELFWHYYPDASKADVANELMQKISDAKNQIREMYPDENTEAQT